MDGITAGRGKGFLSFDLADGGDQTAQQQVQQIRRGRGEVIAVYREWKQEAGVWENKKTGTVWGYIANTNFKAGASSLALEVHVVRVINQNDAIGTRDYSIDLINGASNISGETAGPRQPQPIDPPFTPDSDDWGETLNG